MRLIGEKLLYSGWGRFKLLQVQMNEGSVVQRQMEDHGAAAAVLPYDAGRRAALLVRQPQAGPL